MSEFIKVGSVVVLKGQHVPMTIDALNADSTAVCVWFIGGVLQRATFPFEALESYESPKPEDEPEPEPEPKPSIFSRITIGLPNIIFRGSRDPYRHRGWRGRGRRGW
jgi:uncharacterized protein YodC (DUF2158 family)